MKYSRTFLRTNVTSENRTVGAFSRWMLHCWIGTVLVIGASNGFSAIGQDDRIWLDVKINGQPVHLIFDTGGSGSFLFRRTAQRLNLKLTEPPANVKIGPGQVRSAITEPCDVAFGGQVTRFEFHVVDLPPAISNRAEEGAITWSEVSSNGVYVFDATTLTFSVRSNVPPYAQGWLSFKQKPDSKILGFDIRPNGGGIQTVYVDTGSPAGLSLSHSFWEKALKSWLGQAYTMSAHISPAIAPADEVVVSREYWVREINLGPLRFTEMPVQETDAAEERILNNPNYVATLGLYGLRRLDFIWDRNEGKFYVRPKKEPPPPYRHNKIGAVFVPASLGSDPLVARVAQESPAYRTGIRDGDRLMKINGRDVTGWRTDPRLLQLGRWNDSPAGTAYELTLQRDGRDYEAKVVLSEILGPASSTVASEESPQVADIRRKAEQGDSPAQTTLGMILLHGKFGVKQDPVEAIRWFRKAAASNHPVAQNYLGLCYVKGAGVEPDLTEAARWFRLAAEHDYTEAQTTYGLCCLQGNGVARDEAEAVKWFLKAARKSDAAAQNYLGACYANGLGVEKDMVEGYKWFSLASAQGNEQARKNGALLAERLTAKQIAEALKRARDGRAQQPAFSQPSIRTFVRRGKTCLDSCWYGREETYLDQRSVAWRHRYANRRCAGVAPCVSSGVLDRCPQSISSRCCLKGTFTCPHTKKRPLRKWRKSSARRFPAGL